METSQKPCCHCSIAPSRKPCLLKLVSLRQRRSDDHTCRKMAKIERLKGKDCEALVREEWISDLGGAHVGLDDTEGSSPSTLSAAWRMPNRRTLNMLQMCQEDRKFAPTRPPRHSPSHEHAHAHAHAHAHSTPTRLTLPPTRTPRKHPIAAQNQTQTTARRPLWCVSPNSSTQLADA
jgi:hypothetical protein